MGLLEIKPEMSERERIALINCNNAWLAQRIPIGTILPFAGSTIPAGTLLCNGQAVSRHTEYAELFALIGTAYGSGNGSTTFNVPNLKGRVPVGYDASQSEFNTLGKTGGEKTHTLTESQIPSHAHNITSASSTNEGAINTNQLAIGREGTTYSNKNPIANTGGGQAHNNLQPYVTINYIIIARPEVTHGDIESALADLVVETQSARDNANTAAQAAQTISDTVQQKLDNGDFVGEKGDPGEVTLEQLNTALATKADKVQEAWITPTLLNGWKIQTEVAPHVGYFKDSMGIVHMRGFVTGGAAGTIIFHLPEGYRPAQISRWAVYATAAFGSISIVSNGAVYLISGSTARVSLNEISFRAEG